jgi:hypothetical protein
VTILRCGSIADSGNPQKDAGIKEDRIMATRVRRLEEDSQFVRDAHLNSRREFMRCAAALVGTMGLAPRLLGAAATQNHKGLSWPLKLTRPFQFEVTNYRKRDDDGRSLREFAFTLTGANRVVAKWQAQIDHRETHDGYVTTLALSQERFSLADPASGNSPFTATKTIRLTGQRGIVGDDGIRHDHILLSEVLEGDATQALSVSPRVPMDTKWAATLASMSIEAKAKAVIDRCACSDHVRAQPLGTVQLGRLSEPSAGYACVSLCAVACEGALVAGPEAYAACGAACLLWCEYEYGD